MVGNTTLRLAAALAALAALATCGGTAAQAAPATPEEAQRLTTLFERYVGHPDGQASAVTVVPHGDAYTASLDITRLLAFAAKQGAAVTAGALAAELTPQADGRWHVAVDSFPPIGVTQGDQAFSFLLDGYKFDGLFDPAIHAFATASTATSGSTTRATGQQQGPLDIKLTETGLGTTQAVDAGSGAVDVKTASSIKDVTYAVTLPPQATPSAVTPLAATTKVTAASLETAFSVAHEPIVAIEDLWQFLVAHPSKPALVANQAELKTRLKALIPLSTATSVDIKLARLAVETSMGAFGLDAFAEHYDDTGPDAKGGAFTRIAASGLHLPSGIVPAWAEALLPTSIDVGQSYGPIDMTSGLLLAIDDFDLAAEKPLTDEQQAAVLAAFSGGDKVLTIAPSTIATPTLTLKFSGETRLTKPLPTGSGTLSALGLDKTIEAVRAAAPNDPQAAQAIAVLMAAKATGKAEGPDSYSWKIEAATGGAVTINGLPLAGAGPAPKGKGRKAPPLTP